MTYYVLAYRKTVGGFSVFQYPDLLTAKQALKKLDKQGIYQFPFPILIQAIEVKTE